jgi:hypothetical protein
VSESRPDVLVLSLTPGPVHGRVRDIAEFMGAEARVLSLPSNSADLRGWLGAERPRVRALVIDADAAAALAEVTGDVTSAFGRVTSHALVFGFAEGNRHTQLLHSLSSGVVTGVTPPTRSIVRYCVSDSHREWAGPLSGVSIDSLAGHRGFVTASSGRLETIVRADGLPLLAQVAAAPARIVLLGAADVADLNETVDHAAAPASWFANLTPLMMFLRASLGQRIWRNENPQACFIIDDPLLRRRYGFLEYDALISSMRGRKFQPSIAFIPWNCSRSSRRVARLVGSNFRRTFLCVHGCDHTRAEFADRDAVVLTAKAQLALERMRRHSRLTGLPFDDVMVFPQGLFSPEAMTALGAAGYLAAVNSDVQPSTGAVPRRLRELLDVALPFGRIPLFGRRYPRDTAEFACDLFLGKPALAVEHHVYFREGYAALAAFVDRLNALEDRLEWTNLGTICSSACLTRTADDGAVHKRFYTDRFSLSNTASSAREFVLHRRWASNDVPATTLDGRRCDAWLERDELLIPVRLDGGDAAHVTIHAGAEWTTAPAAPSLRTRLAVSVRRRLSEFRDNYVVTNPVYHGLTRVALGRNAPGGASTALHVQ